MGIWVTAWLKETIKIKILKNLQSIYRTEYMRISFYKINFINMSLFFFTFGRTML